MTVETSSIINLGTLGGTGYYAETYAWGISNSGEVVGDSTDSASGLGQAFSWLNGAITSLAPGPEMTGDIISYGISSGSAVNDSGQVVGQYFRTGENLSSLPTAVIWHGQTISYLPSVSGSIYDSANAINASGQIVGLSNSHAVLWENGAVIDLSAGAPAGTKSDAYGINASGIVVGYSGADLNSEEAAVWQNGVLTTLGSDTYTALAVNAKGVVVGSGTTGFSWYDGTLTMIGGTRANAINDAGWIVGEGKAAVGIVTTSYGIANPHAALFEGGIGIDLNALLPANSGWSLTDATGINDRGQIVGYGTYQGVSAAFLLDLEGNVTSGLTVKAAQSLPSEPSLSGDGYAITDSAANVGSALDGLQAIADAGHLVSVALTDSGVPSIAVSASQLTDDASVLSDMVGNFTLTVTAGSSSAILPALAGHGMTADFSGDAKDYTVSENAGAILVSQGSLTYTLPGVTALHFADVSEIVAATPGPASAVTTGNVTELYAAVLNREPDVGGLVFYQNFLNANPGTPLQTFADFFLNSSEYKSSHTYEAGTAGDTQFIEDSYQNLLHRTPSSDEVNFYLTNVMTKPDSHALMLVYFSASAEFLSDVQITAANPASTEHWLILT